MMKQPAGVDAELVGAIWGLDSVACAPDLGAFLEREISWISGFHPPLERHDVPYLVAVLKANPNVPRSKIQSAMEESCRGAASDPGVTLPGSIPPSLSRAILSGAGKNETVVPKTLKYTVRIMLGLSLNVEGKAGLGLRESWEPSQSLQKVIETIFPSGSDEKPTNAAPTPIKQTKLRAFYLKDYAGVTLVWTRNISEHLSLSTSDMGPKSLTVFKHVSLLEAEQVAVEGEENADMKLNESLALGCYSPAFILETLMTYKLLFPLQDAKRLNRLIEQMSSSRAKGGHGYLPSNDPEDARLTWPATIHLPPSQVKFERQIYNSADLSARYKYWGERLQILYEEAETPTPVTRLDKWIERRKSPGYTFWITFVAFSVAIFFGIVSSILGVIQIWIAYCGWRKGSGMCGTADGAG